MCSQADKRPQKTANSRRLNVKGQVFEAYELSRPPVKGEPKLRRMALHPAAVRVDALAKTLAQGWQTGLARDRRRWPERDTTPCP